MRCLKTLPLSLSFVMDTLNFLRDHNLDEIKNILGNDLKRLLNLQEVIFCLKGEGNAFEELSKKILCTIESPVYLELKEGHQFISFLLRLNVNFTKVIILLLFYLILIFQKYIFLYFGFLCI